MICMKEIRTNYNLRYKNIAQPYLDAKRSYRGIKKRITSYISLIYYSAKFWVVLH